MYTTTYRKNNFLKTLLLLKHFNEQTKPGAFKRCAVRCTRYLTMTTELCFYIVCTIITSISISTYWALDPAMGTEDRSGEAEHSQGRCGMYVQSKASKPFPLLPSLSLSQGLWLLDLNELRSHRDKQSSLEPHTAVWQSESALVTSHFWECMEEKTPLSTMFPTPILLTCRKKWLNSF